MRDFLYMAPGTGDTLEFDVGTPVSGVLDPNEFYRLTTDADCWFDLDGGGDNLTGYGPNAALLVEDDSLVIRTNDARFVLSAMGVTTSGLMNYIRMDR